MKSDINIEKGLGIYASGNLLIFSSVCNYSGVFGDVSLGDRGCVTGFSESSARRMRKFLRETRAEYRSMVTLTYPRDAGNNGRRSKEELRRFIQQLRRHSEDKSKWSAFWFLEFQGNGRVHFHILCTDYYPYKWIAETWSRIVDSENRELHEMCGTRIEKIRLGRNGIASYAAKYAAKFDQKLVPENFGWVGRFWGVQGYRERVAAATWASMKQQAAPYVQNAIQNIKSELGKLLKSKKASNITSRIKDLSHGITVYGINDWSECEKMMYRIRFLELWIAIDEGREPKIPWGDIEGHYEKLIEDPEYSSFVME